MKNKISIIILVLITLMNIILPVINAAEIAKADLIYDHSINTHIKFYNAGKWYPIKCGYICYKIDGEKYPAYCIKHGVHGVDEEGDYTVTVNDLLKDKLIYNTILNGYPYKTPEQLGVETIDDAYVATKHAVNTVLLDRDVYSFYKAEDEKGEKIINAIYEISQKGKAGNEVNQDAKVNIAKVGKLIEDGNYYYQEYKVTANRNISTYKVDEILNFPTGTYISNIDGVKQKVFNDNEKFRIMIPKEKMNEDISGIINASAYCNTKPIFFGEAPRNDIQNYAVTYKPYAEYNSSVNFNIKTNTASIKVMKKDEESLEPIRDVEFGLYKKDNTLIEKLKTNNNGEIIFSDLYQGEYIIKEENANENYLKRNEVFNISTQYNKQIIKEITNKHKKGNLKITKVDKDDNSITLGGIEFDLYDSNNRFIMHLITDANGEASIDNINTGTYILKETKTRREYNLCVDNDILVKWNETSNILIENEKKKGQIKIIKEDKENSNVKLEGVKFQLTNNKGNVVDRLITNKDGEAISNKLPIGKYTVKEISLGKNFNYILDEKEYLINVQDKEIIEFIAKNEYKKGNIKITKVDKDDNNIVLNDVEFDLIDSDNNIVRKIKTDSKGEAYISNIKIGKYILRETKTKNEYCLCEDKEIEVGWNKTSNILIENEKKKGQLEIYKIDQEDKAIKINGVIFELIDLNGTVVERLTTNSNGYAISKKLPIGEYYLKEIKTDNKYVLDNKIIKIDIKHNKISTQMIENARKKATIKVIKKSSNYSHVLNINKGAALEGTIFEIYNSNNDLVDIIITNENGEAESKKLDIGRYKVKEKKATKGYLLNDNDFMINLTEDNQVKILNVENDPIIPEVKIEKKGQEFAERNEEIKYEFNIKNNSNTSLDEFYLKENLPYKQIKATKLITGIYNENINYKIYYKTEDSDYIFLKQVNSLTSEYIDLDYISNEKSIIEIKIEYGKVPKEFKSVINPTLYVKVNDNVKKDEYIYNVAELYGTIEEFKIKDKSVYTTQIREKEIIKKLPKTGC